MSKPCSTTCCSCGRKFNRFSPYLLNLADSFLPTFYSLPPIKQALLTHSHPTLCSSCLLQHTALPPSALKVSPKGFLYTSNLFFLLSQWGIHNPSLEQQLIDNDNKGISLYKSYRKFYLDATS